MQQNQRALQSDSAFIEHVNICLQNMFLIKYLPLIMLKHCQMPWALQETCFSLKEIISLMARILSGFLTMYTGPPEGCALCSSSEAALGFLTLEYSSSLPPFPLGLAVQGIIRLLQSWRMPTGKAIAHLSAMQCIATIHGAKTEMERNSRFHTC